MNELTFIRAFVFNSDFRDTVKNFVNENMFIEDSSIFLMRLIIESMKNTSRFPENNLTVLVMDNPYMLKSEVVDGMMSIIDEKMKPEFERIELLEFVPKAEEFIKRRLFMRVMEIAGSQLDKKDGNIDYKRIENHVKEINTFSLQDSELLSVNNNDTMFELLTTEDDKLPTGWKALDSVTDGGFFKEALVVMQAGTGVGKTRFLLSLANRLRKTSKNYRVLYVTLEIPQSELAKYSECHIFNKDIETMKKMVVDEKEKWLSERKDLLEGLGVLEFLDWPGKSCTPDSLERVIEKKIALGEKPDWVLIDYVQLMRSNSNKSLKDHEKAEEIMGELLSFTKKYGIPVITLVQPNRAGNKLNATSGSGASMMDVGRGISYAEYAAFFGNIIMTKEMEDKDIQILYVLKNRMSPKKHIPLSMKVVDGQFRVEMLDSLVSEFSADERKKADVNTNFPPKG